MNLYNIKKIKIKKKKLIISLVILFVLVVIGFFLIFFSSYIYRFYHVRKIKPSLVKVVPYSVDSPPYNSVLEICRSADMVGYFSIFHKPDFRSYKYCFLDIGILVDLKEAFKELDFKKHDYLISTREVDFLYCSSSFKSAGVYVIFSSANTSSLYIYELKKGGYAIAFELRYSYFMRNLRM